MRRAGESEGTRRRRDKRIMSTRMLEGERRE